MTTYDEWKTTNPADFELGNECESCKEFFARFRCAAATHGECDCPKCQGYCKCQPDPDAKNDARRDDALWQQQFDWED